MNSTDNFLLSLGWNNFFQSSFDELKAPDLRAARIISQGRGHYHIQMGAKEIVEAVITTKIHKSSTASGDFPAVGDWVAFAPGQGREKAIIHHVLKRKSSLRRRRAGTVTSAQHIAANVDFTLIVTSLNEDFDIERLGRYLEIGKESGAEYRFILTKADLCSNPQDYIARLQKEFGDVPSFLISATDESSMDALKPFFAPGVTSVLLGSSGVGKSTLTNYLMGLDLQKTGTLGIDSKGRHTTTARNLLITRWGGLVIDTPGMQEILAMSPNNTEEIPSAFPEIEALALECKFTNCRHQNDPGCAITEARKKGILSAERWAAYLKAQSKIIIPKKKWEK